MYLQQALRQHDAKEFVQAVVKEVNRHVDCKNWSLKKTSKVPDDIQIIPSVWSVQRKRDLTTKKVKSQKARLNFHGRKKIYGMNYFKTYAPVVTWFEIRLMIMFGIIFCWALCQINFIMAYPQAPIKMDIYIELPQGIQSVHGNSKDHVMKSEKNIYGQKQASHVWNSFLVDKLLSIGFTPSLIDDCVFFCNDIIFMVYVDDGIFLGNDDSKLQDAIKEIQDLGLHWGPRSPSWLSWCPHQETTRWFIWVHPMCPKLILSLMPLDLRMQWPSLCLPRCLYSSMHLRTNHLLASTSTTGLQLVS